jgi:hypothetical protein
MASKGRKKVSLHDLTRERFRQEDITQLQAELSTGTDRSRAIVACALLDTALANALRVRFVVDSDTDAMLYGQTAFLGSFSARIRLGHALAIYGTKTFRLLNSVRNVRNAFAHSVRPISFTHELVAEQFATWPSVQFAAPPASEHRNRDTYVAVCIGLAQRLDEYANEHSEKPVKTGFDVP